MLRMSLRHPLNFRHPPDISCRFPADLNQISIRQPPDNHVVSQPPALLPPTSTRPPSELHQVVREILKAIHQTPIRHQS
eukprot:10970456-Karenia_brevis.AAC.1